MGPPGGVLYAAEVIRRALRALWSEPAIEAPPPTPPWWDLALVAVLVPASVVEGTARDDVPWAPVTVALAVVCVASLLWRRSHPLVAVIVGIGAQTLAGVGPELAGLDEGVLLTTAVVLALPYSLCRWASGRAAVVGVAFVLACHWLREPLYGNPLADNLVGAGFLLLPAAVGAAVRFRVTARRREVDQARLREREQLARELHDTVAHHVSGIVVQAQAGRAVAATDPARAVDVLAVIEEAATRSLAEMRTIVGILRDGAEAERAPIGRIADLEALASAPTRRLPVEVTCSGPLGALPTSVDTAVYRIVQEAVTNAERHARHATRVDVRVAGGDDDVRVSVVDDGRGGGDQRPGYGLTGMAERVELLGGTFHAGPRLDGGWSVEAVVPVEGPRR